MTTDATDEAAFEAWWRTHPVGTIAHPYGSDKSYRLAYLAGRSSQRPSPSVGREEVARIIAPVEWASHDHCVFRAANPPQWAKHAVRYTEADFLRMAGEAVALSLAKADAILALAQPATGAVEGEWVTELRAAVGRARDATDKYVEAALYGATSYNLQRIAIDKWAIVDELFDSVPTLPAGEWTEEQVEAAAYARFAYSFIGDAKAWWAAHRNLVEQVEIPAFRAALATITPTAGGRPTTTKEK